MTIIYGIGIFLFAMILFAILASMCMCLLVKVLLYVDDLWDYTIVPKIKKLFKKKG